MIPDWLVAIASVLGGIWLVWLAARIKQAVQRPTIRTRQGSVINIDQATPRRQQWGQPAAKGWDARKVNR